MTDASGTEMGSEEEATMKNDPGRVRVSGPLSAYRGGFAEELARQGYTPGSAQRQVGLLAHLSRWLDSRGLGAADLTPECVEEFLGARRAEGYTIELSQRGVLPLLVYLRVLGVAPVPPEPGPCTPAELLVRQYGHYLAAERGLAAVSIEGYLSTARLFLSERERPDGLDLAGLTARDVTAFVVGQCRSRRAGSAKTLVTALRSLLRFLFLQGCTPCPLAQAVPTATGWADQRLPRPLGAEAVPALLASCDRHTLAGARDFAILTVLRRLGLRAGEVAALQLGDIDWRHGEIAVRGKGGRRDRLPLPADVGEAVVAYLRRRPRVRCRALFLRVRAPIAGLTSDGVQDVVRGSCMRAGLPVAGAHRLRHHAATAMLAGGASLAEVGQVLRHARPATTSLYAKVDRVALRRLARPWPGGAR
jgi:integrase/recombinase XerD